MAPPSRSGQRLYLDTGITYLKGVGPARAEAFRRLGVITAGELLYHIPHRYEDASGMAGGRVLSLYPATEGLSFKIIRSIIDQHLDALLPLVTEYLPSEILATADVPAIREALRMVHRPASLAEAMQGRARLAFEELFFVNLLHLRAKSLAREERRGIRFENKRDLTTRLKEMLPFQLTGAQTRSTREIVADMCSPHRMQRLLQGDVGSGKTIVALFA